MLGESKARGRSGAETAGGGVGWWADDMSLSGCKAMESECVRRYHSHETAENQCSSALFKHIKAPIHLVRSLSSIAIGILGFSVLVERCADQVWSLVRRFDEPQKYKPFVSKCVVKGDMEIGSLREVNVKSGLPATTSTERLELLDDDEHVFSIRIVGGDHRLKNYSSVITLRPESIDGRVGTLVIESFVVDIPDGNTKDETCFFIEALIKCNLKSLTDVSERLVVQDLLEPIDRQPGVVLTKLHSEK